MNETWNSLASWPGRKEFPADTDADGSNQKQKRPGDQAGALDRTTNDENTNRAGATGKPESSQLAEGVMMPSTTVRNRPRLPITFAGLVGSLLEGEPRPKSRATYNRCVALQDDGTICGLPARYIDMQRGGHVCHDHRPEKRKAVAV